MSSPFHGGDVGSAIQSAKARGVPMLVALHGASHPRSDALDAAWRRADVASEISDPKRWIALRLEDREGEAGAAYRVANAGVAQHVDVGRLHKHVVAEAQFAVVQHHRQA